MDRQVFEEREMKRAFDKIAAGLDDAIAYAKGDTFRGRLDSAEDERHHRRNSPAQPGDRFSYPRCTLYEDSEEQHGEGRDH